MIKKLILVFFFLIYLVSGCKEKRVYPMKQTQKDLENYLSSHVEPTYISIIDLEIDGHHVVYEQYCGKTDVEHQSEFNDFLSPYIGDKCDTIINLYGEVPVENWYCLKDSTNQLFLLGEDGNGDFSIWKYQKTIEDYGKEVYPFEEVLTSIYHVFSSDNIVSVSYSYVGTDQRYSLNKQQIVSLYDDLSAMQCKSLSLDEAGRIWSSQINNGHQDEEVVQLYIELEDGTTVDTIFFNRNMNIYFTNFVFVEMNITDDSELQWEEILS